MIDDAEIALIADAAEKMVEGKLKQGEIPSVEDVQDAVEASLIARNHPKTAKAYILYRAERTRIREADSRLMHTLTDIIKKDAADSDIKRENANINGDTAMGSMLKIGSETSKYYYDLHVLNPIHAKAHREGDIHIHDLDFLTQTTTCCQIELSSLFQGGFSTGHGVLREPNDIASYSALACIAIQANQNDQHGGQSIVDFDYGMAPGVKKTFIKNYRRNLARVLEIVGRHQDPEIWAKEILENIQHNLGLVPEFAGNAAFDQEMLQHHLFGIEKPEMLLKIVHKNAVNETRRATYQAMEALIHNLNTMNSRAGAQVPFSSINYGTDTSPEGRLVIEQLLLATEAGLGGGETPIFPVQIFKIKEGVNYNPGDPNYDLYHLAIRVSAKRLFPNFSFLDAPFNLKYYKPGHPETEAAYMGAVTGEDVITIRVDGRVHTLPFKEAYDRFHEWPRPVEILDRGNFVKIKAWQNYPDGGDWYDVKFSNGRYLRMTSDHPLPTQRGRVMCQDLKVGDEVPLADYTCITEGNAYPPLDPWVLGVLLCDGNRDAVITLGMDERDIADALIEKCGGRINEQHRGKQGDYLEVFLKHGDDQKVACRPMQTYFGACNKKNRRFPLDYTAWAREDRMKLLAGIIDADGYFKVKGNTCYAYIGSVNKQLALQEMILAESLGFDTKLRKTTYGKGEAYPRYSVEFRVTEEIPVVCGKKKDKMFAVPANDRPITATITEITFVGATGQRRYDVTTESDRFDVSGINSHNCRTRVLGNVHDPSREIASRRGNLSFTSINLPRIAINAGGDWEKFFNDLAGKMQLVKGQLLERLEIVSRKKVYNSPFLMGQGVWLDSEKLEWDQEVREVLKHGTLSIGFIGLAECLKMMTGKHHGESAECQELGLKIVGFMRGLTDKMSQDTKLNFTLLATPAEGLSGRFVRMDRERFGVIEGVTDREYYTNSFHVPVYYPISAFEKIEIEGPYHELTNAGHISYVEMDGDPTKNLEAFEKIIRHMHDCGVGYGSINHPVDRDPVCGYNGIIGDTCPKCGRVENGKKFDRIRRITGYLVGTLDRFNNSKRAEERDRVKHG